MMEALVDRVATRIGASFAAPPVPADIQNEVDAMWRERFATQDTIALHEQFVADGEFLVLDRFVPQPIVDRALREIDAERPVRSRVPWVRSAQHVGWRALQRIAPFT